MKRALFTQHSDLPFLVELPGIEPVLDLRKCGLTCTYATCGSRWLREIPGAPPEMLAAPTPGPGGRPGPNSFVRNDYGRRYEPPVRIELF